jgi:hypothetical protein
MTFADILADAYDRSGHPQSPDTAVARRFKGFVNRWNRKVLTDKGMEATPPRDDYARVRGGSGDLRDRASIHAVRLREHDAATPL